MKLKMNKALIPALSLMLCVGLVLSGCAGTPSGENGDANVSAETIRMQPASWQENGFWSKHIDYFAEYVNTHSDRIVIEPTMPGAIVPVDQQTDSVSSGLTAAMAVPSAYLAGTIPLGYVWATPPLVRSVEDMKYFMEEYEGGRAGELWKEAVEAKYNVVVVGYMYGPADALISSSKPLNSIKDLKGLKIRVGAGAIAEALTDFGASTVFAPGSEIYSMLSSKTIDATVMGSPADHLSSSFDEVTSYWLKEPFLNSTHATTFIVNKNIWNKLTADEQQLLKDAIEHSTSLISEEGETKIKDAWVTAAERGIELEEWSEEEQAMWHAKFFEKCSNYSDDPSYVEFIDLLEAWAKSENLL